MIEKIKELKKEIKDMNFDEDKETYYNKRGVKFCELWAEIRQAKEYNKKIQKVKEELKEGWEDSLKENVGDRLFCEGWNLAVSLFLEKIDKVFSEGFGEVVE